MGKIRYYYICHLGRTLGSAGRMKLAITNSFNSARDMFFWNKCKTYNKNHQNQEFPRSFSSGSPQASTTPAFSPVPAVFLRACLLIHRSQSILVMLKTLPKMRDIHWKKILKNHHHEWQKPTWNHNISSYVHMYIYIYIYVCVSHLNQINRH